VEGGGGCVVGGGGGRVVVVDVEVVVSATAARSRGMAESATWPHACSPTAARTTAMSAPRAHLSTVLFGCAC